MDWFNLVCFIILVALAIAADYQRERAEEENVKLRAMSQVDVAEIHKLIYRVEALEEERAALRAEVARLKGGAA